MSTELTGIKVPCEMARYALKEKVIQQVGIYLTSHFHYSGKAKNLAQIIREFERYLAINDRQIRRGLNWLIDRNWIQRSSNNWYYFRSIDNIHRMEGWEFARATRMYPKDLKHLQPYFAASFFSSLIETGIWENRTVRKNRRTETPKHPISLSSIQKMLECSKDTARKIRNSAEQYNYISNNQNLIKITNISSDTLKYLKMEGVESFNAELFGYPGSRIITVDRIRYKEGSLYVQMPNLIESKLQIKSRRGLNKNSLSGY